jgi:Mce-associated membrane protein
MTDDQPAPVKLTKAERLEAKAARLREQDERRAEQGGSAASNTGLVVAVSLLGVLSAVLVALLLVGYFSWRHQRDSDHALNAARSSALTAATSFAVDFGSYDYRNLSAEFREVETRLTPSFRKSFSQSSAGLVPTIVKYKGSVKATVQGAGLTTATTSKATVVLFLDQTVTTTQSSVPRIDRNRLQVYLVRSSGTWLVSKLLVV